MDKSLKELMMDRIYSMKDRTNWDVCLKKSFDSFFNECQRRFLACGSFV